MSPGPTVTMGNMGTLATRLTGAWIEHVSRWSKGPRDGTGINLLGLRDS